MDEAIKEVLIKLLNNEEIKGILKGVLLESVVEGIAISSAKEQEKKLLMTSEVCKMLSISRLTLDNWTKTGKVRKIKVEGFRRNYFSLADINKILLQNKKPVS